MMHAYRVFSVVRIVGATSRLELSDTEFAKHGGFQWRLQFFRVFFTVSLNSMSFGST